MAKVSSAKAKKILRDGSVRGHALTTKQKGFFGAIAGGSRMRKMAAGGATARENILQGMKEGGGTTGKHKMPDGHMMPDKQMRKHMKKMADGGGVDDSTNEASTSAIRKSEHIPRKYSESKTNIIEGMQDGGMIAGPTFEGAAGPDKDAEGLKAVASVFAALGEPGIKALTEGLKNARVKYSNALYARDQPASTYPNVMGNIIKPPRPNFEDILREEVASHWNNLGRSRSVAGQIPGQPPIP